MKIITVFKTHFDIGFTELSSEVVARYSGKMIKDVIKTCNDTYPLGEKLCYKWTMSAWPLVQMLEHAEEGDRKAAEELIARGQLLWHALPFTTHTECCGVEDFVRGFDFARELCKRYHKPFPIAAKMTDVPGHTGFLVEALAKAGVKFLHLGCNPACTPPEVPMLFWLESKDGGRVLTFYNKTYGSSVLPPKNWPYPVWFNMNQTNDNIGPQDARVIEELVAAAGENELVIGSLDDVYRELLPHLGEEVPVVKSELADAWIHGVGTYPKEVGELRRVRERLAAASKVQAREKVFDARLEKLFQSAYADLLLFSEHTWGLDVKTHLGAPKYKKADFTAERGDPRYKKLELSWDEQRDRVRRAEKAAEEIESILGIAGEKARPSAGEGANAALSLRADKKGNVEILSNGERLLKICGAEYRIAGSEEMCRFLRAYVRRFPVWAIFDYGRVEYPECEGELFLPVSAEVEKRADGLTVTHFYDERAAKEFGWAEKTVTTYKVENGRVRVRFEVEACATPYAESASLKFLPAEKGISINKLGGMVDPAKDVAVDANHVAFCTERFVDLNGDTLAVLSKDAALVSMGEDLLFKFHRRNEARGKAFYFNLFNTMWGTNFPQWIEGKLAYEFEIVPHPAGDRSLLYEADDAALELCGAALESVRVEGGEALYRIREINGKAATATFAAKESAWKATDWFGEHGTRLPVSEGRVQLALRPYEIVTVRPMK